MSIALAWLEARRPAPPQALMPRLRAALRAEAGAAAPVSHAHGSSAPDRDVPEHLAAAALALLRRAADAADRRDHDVALELLAGDALLTYACEAAAEQGPDRIETLAAASARALLEDVEGGG